MVAALSLSCSGAEGPGYDGAYGGSGNGSGPCEDGAEQVCSQVLSQENGVLACLEGRKFCEDGRWTECLGSEVTYRPDPRSSDYQGFFRNHASPQAFLPPESLPARCDDNPCDPYCWFYDEDPTDITAAPPPPSGPPNYPGGPGGQACDHDMCETGTPLYGTCHSCVEQVCANTPSCCTTAWTQACVNLTYTLCANERPPLYLCDFGLFSNSSLTIRNNGSANAVVGAYGNVTLEADTKVAGIYATGNLTWNSLNGAAISAPTGIVVDGNVTGQDSNSTFNTFIEAGGSVYMPSWDVQQYVRAGTTLTGQNSSTIIGSASANGGISTISSIGGTQCSTAGCYTHRPVVLPPRTAGNAIPTLATNCTGTTDYSSNGTTVTVPGPGVYRDVNVINNGRVVLNGEGTYYFRNFAVTNRIEFRRTATNTGQGWQIRTCGNVSLGNDTLFVGNTVGATPAVVVDSVNNVVMDPALITFFASQSGTISIGTNVFMTGIFIAPNATVVKADVGSSPTQAQILAGTRAAPINGAIWSQALSLGTGSFTKQMSRSACEGLNIPGAADDLPCSTPPLGLCDFGLFSSSTNQVTLDSLQTTSNVTVGGLGNITIMGATGRSVQRVVTSGPVRLESQDLPAGGVLAGGTVSIQTPGTNRPIGPIEAVGNVDLYNRPVVSGDVRTRGNLTWETLINGNALAGGTINLNGGCAASVTGTCTSGSTHAAPTISLPTLPAQTFTCAGGSSYTAATQTLTPGNYGDVVISGTLTLNGPGTYNFQRLYARDIVLSGTGARFNVQTCNEFNMYANGRILEGPTTVLADPTRFYASVRGNLHFDANVTWVGVVQAASSGTKTGGSIHGAIWASPVNNIVSQTSITGISAAACAGMALPGTVGECPGACPITNVTPDVPPALNEPCGSGLDCQINHRCVGPETPTACAHSKCMPGAALSATCDTCVDRICDVDPTCCSGSWTTACVAKVATVCDAVCEPYSCYAPDLCAPMAAPVASTCSSCVASICAVDASCCTTAWTQACADRVYTICGSGIPTTPTGGTSICDYSAYSNGTVAIQGANSPATNRAYIYGGSVGGAGLGAMTVQYARVEGNVLNAGSFNTYTTDITGNLTYGSGSNAITATTYANLYQGSPPQPARPTRTFTCSGGTTPTSGTIAPGHYGNVSIPNGSTLTLQPGTYYFTSLTIGGATGGTTANRGTLALPSTGNVTINVCGAVTYNGYGRMTGLVGAQAANVNTYATGNINITTNAIAYGIMNSNTGVAVGAGSTLYGYAWAGSALSVQSSMATIDSRNLGDACRSTYDPTYVARRMDRLCGYSTYGQTGLAVTGTTFRGGDVGSGALATVNDTSNFYGNLLSIGNVAKGTTATQFFQTIRTRGTISGGARVYGGQTAGASAAAVPAPPFPTVSFSCTSGRPPGGVDQNLWGATLAPGTWGHINQNGDGQNLTLQAGDYYVGDFVMRQNGTLTLPASGNVRIFACGRVVFPTGMTLTNGGTAAGNNLGKFRVYSLSTNATDTNPAIYVNSGASRSVAGVLIAPNGKISVGANSTLLGAAWGNSFFSTTGATVNGTGLTGASCEALSVDAPPTCPATVTATPPTEPADCQSNNLGYTDSTCTTFDLAAGIPCDDTVPICNHGLAAFNGNLTLGYWDETDGQMGTEYPSQTPDGTCSFTGLSIAPGNCVDVTCTLPGTAMHTLLVDSSNSLNECGTGFYDRRLDNWTVHDRRTCGSSTTEVEYLYEAECPDDTSPLWGYLTWNTTTPGTSEIVFSAANGQSAAELATPSYQVVGEAHATPTNTSVCSLTWPTAACAVGLSDELGLAQNQGRFLALKIELDPTGGSPVLRDWEVTYTCQYDQ